MGEEHLPATTPTTLPAPAPSTARRRYRPHPTRCSPTRIATSARPSSTRATASASAPGRRGSELRHTRLERAAVDTQGNGATSYAQSFTAPFAALSWAPAAGQLLYASWGRGIESDVAPVLPMYTNAGQALPAAKSHRWRRAGRAAPPPGTGSSRCSTSAGLPGATWAPATAAAPAARARSKALSATAASTPRSTGRRGEWSARVGAQWLHARIEGTGDPALDGTRPPNVPERSLLAGLAWSSAALPGLAVQATARYEGPREVLPDNSIRIGELDHRRSRGPLRATGRRRRLDRAPRGEQRLRPRGLERIAVPVQPRLSVSAGAANVANVAAGRPLGDRTHTDSYNLRLFLDSSVGRAPDC